ncbi:FMN-binding negative transcriptional regulator [Paenibacillus agricola]|uniref:FMN-binding negative transcriptional regulator n=1 Tax=Paenibacillus agricola TaxID=2716264 RepID=A0ABX0JIR2_9BACL|nr:FMN-binding negative transcriptional regulator [Paenibacillus agricola]NHN33776.1 FMN-binding negative transcriptional regulator [Paenibacillus agricola]
MYVPKSFEINEKEQIYDLIEKNSFAILFSQKDDQPFATHLPLLLDRDEGCLYGHMAKANTHWENIESKVLVVFSGAHSYISPYWYETPQSVPTWNYVAVHVYGKLELIEDDNKLIKILDDSVTYYESGKPNPWNMSKADFNLIDSLSKGIVGFKIEITNIEGKLKLSQNHSKERQERVINALEMQDDDNSKQISKLMRENLEKQSR